jgi:hypothetical protein
MAVLHRKEEKIQAVLGRLPKKYNPDDFVAMFIKLYSKDWGKIKSAYIKASQDKEAGTVIHMPKPDLYLKQILEIFLAQKSVIPAPAELPKEETKEEVIVVKSKVSVKKTEKEDLVPEITEPIPAVKKVRANAKKKVD